jgi:hypothetical protein
MKLIAVVLLCLLGLAACATPPTKMVMVVNQYELELRDFDEAEADHLIKSLRYYDHISVTLISMNTEQLRYRYALLTELSAQTILDRSYKALSRIDITTGNTNASYLGNKIILKRLDF